MGVIFTTVLDIFRLRTAPWFSLTISLLAWFTTWAIANGQPVSAAVGTFLLALGFSADVAEATTSFHEWISASPRDDWLEWIVVILATAAGGRYVQALYKTRKSQNEVDMAARGVRNAKSRPARVRTTAETRSQEVAFFEADYRKKDAYDRELRLFELRSQLRCVALFWLTTGIAVEVRGPTVRDLIVVSAATLIAVLITCGMEEFYEDPPSTGESAKRSLANFAFECLQIAALIVRIVLALPLFVLASLLYPPPQKSTT